MTLTPFSYASKAFQLSAITLALTLAGCGGGGVDSVKPEPGTGNGDTPSNPSNPGNGGVVADIKVDSSSIIDFDNNPTSYVSLQGAYYQVKVIDKLGKPIVNAKVSFSIDAAGVSLSQSTSGAVLTNSDGVAQVFLKPDNASVSGAYTISSTVTYKDETVTDSRTFSVQPTDVSFGGLVVENSNLPSAGQTSISM
ncbi:MAG: hypothetical protein Q4P13_12175, partial [Psychrobacter sp.]|nr:hypothetical protein [Psychrobacter sp.]